jgi:hypothetical protein
MRATTLRSEAEQLLVALRRDPLLAQSAYYVATGIWPIVHLRSFMALTGRKRDTWLVQTFGALITATGVAIWPRTGRAGEGERPAQERVAVAAAVALAASDAYFVYRRRIRPVYLGDAAVELLMAAAILGRRRAAAELDERR